MRNDKKKLVLSLKPLIPIEWKTLTRKSDNERKATESHDNKMKEATGSLMNMMSQLYDSGDAKMKQQMTEALQKSMEKK